MRLWSWRLKAYVISPNATPCCSSSSTRSLGLGFRLLYASCEPTFDGYPWYALFSSWLIHRPSVTSCSIEDIKAPACQHGSTCAVSISASMVRCFVGLLLVFLNRRFLRFLSRIFCRLLFWARLITMIVVWKSIALFDFLTFSTTVFSLIFQRFRLQSFAGSCATINHWSIVPNPLNTMFSLSLNPLDFVTCVKLSNFFLAHFKTIVLFFRRFGNTLAHNLTLVFVKPSVSLTVSKYLLLALKTLSVLCPDAGRSLIGRNVRFCLVLFSLRTLTGWAFFK